MCETFKVVKIVSATRIVVNASQNDVERGDILEVYAEGAEIFDPETNESLGMLDYIKARVEVVTVFPKMCICRNAATRTRNLLEPLENFFVRETAAELNVNTADISGGFEGINPKIVLGDLVRKAL
jgi:hypothetical protein